MLLLRWAGGTAPWRFVAHASGVEGDGSYLFGIGLPQCGQNWALGEAAWPQYGQ